MADVTYNSNSDGSQTYLKWSKPVAILLIRIIRVYNIPGKIHHHADVL